MCPSAALRTPTRIAAQDRDPSCSVNTITAAWRCHGCGARGGAYDAALAKGHTPRSAIDLMIAHGLTERRGRLQTARELLNAPRRPRANQTTAAPMQHDEAARTKLLVSDDDVARWQAALSHRPGLLARLAEERGWRYETMTALELGFDRGRITIPIRNRTRATPRPAPLPATTDPPPEDARRARKPARAHTPPQHRNLTTHPARRRAPRHDRRPQLTASPRSPYPETTRGNPPGRDCSPDEKSPS